MRHTLRGILVEKESVMSLALKEVLAVVVWDLEERWGMASMGRERVGISEAFL